MEDAPYWHPNYKGRGVQRSDILSFKTSSDRYREIALKGEKTTSNIKTSIEMLKTAMIIEYLLKRREKRISRRKKEE